MLGKGIFMARNETVTDLWVHDLLKEDNFDLDPQGSSILEIKDALKTASKRGTGNVGRPEYIGVVKDYLILIENKADTDHHIKLNEDGGLDSSVNSITNYAVNGAVFYGRHLAEKTSYTKIFAIGVSGDERMHEMTPYFIDERGDYKRLPDIETFVSFTPENIDYYYLKDVLNEETDKEKELYDLMKDAAILHEALRTYGSVDNASKPLVVSGILLAIREIEFNNFSIDSLTGDTLKTDGSKIFNAIGDNLQRSNVSPGVKKDKLLSQFRFIQDSTKLNTINMTLGKTPLKHYTEFLYNNIYKDIRYSNSSEDILGLFYGEFMSYSGGDKQGLGIVLTPSHITDLFCELLEIKPEDVVLDPTAGTGGFLVAAMHHMIEQTNDSTMQYKIKRDNLHGIELQSYMFTIATTNMILRGDGKSNLLNENFLETSPSDNQLTHGANVGMMNPPYSQGTKEDPAQYEISFTKHLLNSVLPEGRVAVIVPLSTMAGNTKDEKKMKREILKKHSLEGVITLNKDTFYQIGTNPCIAIFTAHEPHRENKEVKFINFIDDGYKIKKHVGLVETAQAPDRKKHLLDVWFDKKPAENAFCVQTTIKPDDEWLHSFYYFNDEIPSEENFRKTLSDYITFETNMISHGRGYLFEGDNDGN